MSQQTDSTPAVTTSSSTVTSTNVNTSTPAGAASAAAADQSTVGSLAELREKSPEVYQAMMQGLAMKICNSMQKHQARYKEILRKGREQH